MEVGVQRVLASVHRGGDGSQCPAFSTYSVLVLHDSGRAQFARVCESSCGTLLSVSYFLTDFSLSLGNGRWLLPSEFLPLLHFSVLFSSA